MYLILNFYNFYNQKMLLRKMYTGDQIAHFGYEYMKIFKNSDLIMNFIKNNCRLI